MCSGWGAQEKGKCQMQGLVRTGDPGQEVGMVSASSLTPEQKETIAGWVAAGDDLNAVQKRLLSELSLNATFMDTRFLVMDLGLEIQTPVEPEPEKPDETAAPGAAVEPEVLSGLQVMIDDDPIPGCMISGVVTFSDGERGMWYVDTAGRPGLEADTPGYQPSSDDIEAFQIKLRNMIQQQQADMNPDAE